MAKLDRFRQEFISEDGKLETTHPMSNSQERLLFECLVCGYVDVPRDHKHDSLSDEEWLVAMKWLWDGDGEDYYIERIEYLSV